MGPLVRGRRGQQLTFIHSFEDSMYSVDKEE